MRVLTVSVLFGFLAMGLTIDSWQPSSNAIPMNLGQSEQVDVTSRGRSTTYRGSGRREILALPLPLALTHLS